MSALADIAAWARSHHERTRDVDLARLVVFIAALIQLLVAIRLFAFPGEPAGDDMSIHLAEIAGIARSLGAGEADLWNPSANGGFASGYYYQWLPQVSCAILYLLFGWLIGLVAVFKLTVLATLALLPATVYRGLRVIGVQPLAAAAGGLGASTVYAYSGWGVGIDSLFTTGLYTQSWALLFYPLAVAYAGRFLYDGEHLGRAVLYTALCGYCHPFIAVAIAPAVICIPWWRVPVASVLRRAVLLFAAALAAAAPLWLPIVIHYDAFGAFPQRVAGEDGMALSLFAKELYRGNFLDLGRWPITTYVAAAGILVAITRRGRVLVPIYAAGFIFAGLIVLGPVLGKMKDDLLPAIRFLAPMQLCFGAAAGVAFAFGASEVYRRLDTLLARRGAPRWPAATAVLVAGIVATGVLAGGVMARSTARVRTVEHWPQLHREELAEVIDFLGEQPWGRVLAATEVGSGSHWWMYLHYVGADRPAVRAYGGASLQSSVNFAFLKELDIFSDHRMFAIRYFIASIEKAESDRFRERFETLPADIVFETEHWRVYRYREAPMFDAVRVGPVARGDRAERIELAIQWFRKRPHENVIVYDDLTATADPSMVTIHEVRHSRRAHAAALTVAGDEAALVRLAVTYHPGWRARIDGRPAPVHRVGPAFVAVEVPPGDHQIAIEFSRPWWTWALYALLFGGGLAWWLRTRRRGVTAAALVLAIIGASGGSADAQPSALPVPVDAAFGPRGTAIVTTTAGAWVRPADSERFHYLCPAVTGSATGAFAPTAAIDASGTFYLTGYNGLRRSADGCLFEVAPMYSAHGIGPFTRRWFSDVEVGGGAVWACTADGTNENDLFVAREPDAPFRSSHLESDRLWYLSVAVGDGATPPIYVTGYRVAREAEEDAEVASALLVSTDGGAGFEALEAEGLTLGRSRRSRVAHVAGNTLYVVAEGALEPDRDVLFRSDDGGATFIRALETRGRIVGVAAAAGAVWVATNSPCSEGDPKDPGCLYRELSAGAGFESFGAPQLSCLSGSPDDELFACRADAVASGIALLEVVGRAEGAPTLTPVLRVADLAAPCEVNRDACMRSWQQTCRILGAECERSAPRDPPPPAPTVRTLAHPERVLLFLGLLLLLAVVPWLLASSRNR